MRTTQKSSYAPCKSILQGVHEIREEQNEIHKKQPYYK
nr:hypothetical protein [Enterococcus hirae]